MPAAAVAAHSLHYTGAKSGPGDGEATVPRGGALLAGGAPRVTINLTSPQIRCSQLTHVGALHCMRWGTWVADAGQVAAALRFSAFEIMQILSRSQL